MKKCLIILMLLTLTACTDQSDIQKYAKIEGWQNATPTGYKFFACSKDDWYHTGFSAVKNGQVISGTICRGVLKGATLRMD